MSERSIPLLLADIQEAASAILEYTFEMTFELFSSDRKTLDAVVRNFEIMGEAANRIPESYQNKHGNIPWRRLIGTRNRLIHGYFGIDKSILWNVICNELPKLQASLKLLTQEQ